MFLDGETLDFEEFCALLEQFWKEFDPEEELRNAFLGWKIIFVLTKHLNLCYLVFDKEGNGFVTQDELKKVMQSMGEVLNDDEMKEMIKDMNVNTDGTINYEGII